jgi:hypothetical protein
MLKSYDPIGTQYLFECIVFPDVYTGPLMTVPDPHLLMSVHFVSSG